MYLFFNVVAFMSWVFLGGGGWWSLVVAGWAVAGRRCALCCTSFCFSSGVQEAGFLGGGVWPELDLVR